MDEDERLQMIRNSVEKLRKKALSENSSNVEIYTILDIYVTYFSLLFEKLESLEDKLNNIAGELDDIDLGIRGYKRAGDPR